MSIDYQSFYDELFGNHGTTIFCSEDDPHELEREIAFHESRRKRKKKKTTSIILQDVLFAEEYLQEDLFVEVLTTTPDCTMGSPLSTAQLVDYLDEFSSENLFIEVINFNESYEIITPFVKKKGTFDKVTSEGRYGSRHVDHQFFAGDDSWQGFRFEPFGDQFLAKICRNRRKKAEHYVRLKIRGPLRYSQALKLQRYLERQIVPLIYAGTFGKRCKIRQAW